MRDGRQSRRGIGSGVPALELREVVTPPAFELEEPLVALAHDCDGGSGRRLRADHRLDAAHLLVVRAPRFVEGSVARGVRLAVATDGTPRRYGRTLAKLLRERL